MRLTFFGKIAQKAIISDGDTILIARDVNELEKWELPGGRLNEGEDPKAGLIRELHEELGVQCKIGDVVHIEQFMHERDQVMTLFMTYEASLLQQKNDMKLSPHEVAEVKWVTETQLQGYTLFDNCKRAADVYFKKKI